MCSKSILEYPHEALSNVPICIHFQNSVWTLEKVKITFYYISIRSDKVDCGSFSSLLRVRIQQIIPNKCTKCFVLMQLRTIIPHPQMCPHRIYFSNRLFYELHAHKPGGWTGSTRRVQLTPEGKAGKTFSWRFALHIGMNSQVMNARSVELHRWVNAWIINIHLIWRRLLLTNGGNGKYAVDVAWMLKHSAEFQVSVVIQWRPTCLYLIIYLDFLRLKI